MRSMWPCLNCPSFMYFCLFLCKMEVMLISNLPSPPASQINCENKWSHNCNVFLPSGENDCRYQELHRHVSDFSFSCSYFQMQKHSCILVSFKSHHGCVPLSYSRFLGYHFWVSQEPWVSWNLELQSLVSNGNVASWNMINMSGQVIWQGPEIPG